MRGRCGEHGIALADDGSCVLCRRTSVPATAEIRPGGVGAAIAVWAVAAAGVFAAVALATIQPLGPVPKAAAEPSFAAGAPAAESAAAPASPVPAPASAPAPIAAKASRWVSEPMGEAPDPGDAERLRALSAQQRERTRALAAQQAEYEAWAHREATREIEEQEARARRLRGEGQPGSAPPPDRPVTDEAMRRVPITMYGASWCGACAQAKAFLAAARIPFTERDVDTDLFAAEEARRLNPRGSIPTFDVAGTTIVGFRPKQLVTAIQSAASRQ